MSNLSYELWDSIAFYAVARTDSFLGPPSILCSLTLVSHQLYDYLSIKNNSHLYARIFRFKFDTLAPIRRLSERWRTTTCLASELVKRFKALKRIKAMELEMDDAWTAYLMMSENDGKNEAQLLHYAKLQEWLKTVIVFRTTARDFTWFNNKVLDSLVMWLFWKTNDRDSIRSEGINSVFRETLLKILHGFILTGYKHPSIYGPDNFHSLPLCDGVTPEGLLNWHPPPTAEITHYSHRLRVCAPVVAPAVILCLIIQADAFRDSSNIPQLMRGAPLNRSEAVARGYEGPTVEDVKDYHLNTRIHTVNRCSLPDPQFSQDVLVEGLEGEDQCGKSESGLSSSTAYDHDWYRMVACPDPWSGDIPLRGPVFTPGILTGRWAGTLLSGDLDLHMTLVNDNSNNQPSHVSVRHFPLYWELQEHQCFSENEVLPLGTDSYFGSDDILNAWIPRGSIFSRINDTLEVYDPNTGNTSHYTTVLPRNTAPDHVPSEKPPESTFPEESNHWEISGEDIVEPMLNPWNPGTSPDPCLSIDDDEQYCDTVSYRTSGIADILITGKTGMYYGEAWGHCTIYGRVRPWDGLIVLLRVPSNPSETALGKWIFKGYLHDKNFVGRWRETSTPVNAIGYEGGFAVYKTENSLDS